MSRLFFLFSSFLFSLPLYSQECQISEQGIEMIKQFEGFSSKPYWDTHSWSIGYGHKSPSIKQYTRSWTEEEADTQLRVDLDVITTTLCSDITRDLSQNEIDAYTSLAYNIGVIRVLRNKYKINTSKVPCDFIRKYNRSQGDVVKGLQVRRTVEYHLCRKKGE